MAATWLLVTLIWGSLAACLRVMSVDIAEAKETDISIVAQCKGGNLTLNEPTPNVTVLYVFREGETLASASVPATGKFKGRLIVDSDGRVTLTGLKSEDLGTYGVEVQLAGDKKTHSIGLVVREPPETIDGKLFVMKNYFTESGSIHLKCGTFTTLGFPPVSAVWKDPAGRILSSDGFEDQYFYLDLPADTADSGDYCCQLDCRAPDFCCLDDQSPLRSCAKLHVQTDKKVEVTMKESVSLEAFSQLQQQVLDLARSLRLQESHQGECNQSAVAAIAHLAQLQANSEAYLNKVEILEKELERSLDNVRNISAEDRVRLQKETNQIVKNVGLQLDYNISEAMETCSDFQQQLRFVYMKLEFNQTSLSTSVETLGQRLDKDLLEVRRSNVETRNSLETNMNQSMQRLDKRIEEVSKAANERFVQLEAERENRIANLQQAITNDTSKLEEKLVQQISDTRISFTEYQQTNTQTLTDVRYRADTRLSALENRLSVLGNTINSHMTSSSQSHETFVSELATLVKKTDAVTESLKNQLITTKNLTAMENQLSTMKMKLTAVENQLSTMKMKLTAEENLLSTMKVKLTAMENQLTAKRCESGREYFSPHDQPTMRTSGWRTEVIHVNFKFPFKTPPWVAVGITRLDVSNWANVRIDVAVYAISTSGFELHAHEWANTHIYSVAAVWVACHV